jgi:hypothetical protein
MRLSFLPLLLPMASLGLQEPGPREPAPERPVAHIFTEDTEQGSEGHWNWELFADIWNYKLTGSEMNTAERLKEENRLKDLIGSDVCSSGGGSGSSGKGSESSGKGSGSGQMYKIPIVSKYTRSAHPVLWSCFSIRLSCISPTGRRAGNVV